MPSPTLVVLRVPSKATKTRRQKSTTSGKVRDSVNVRRMKKPFPYAPHIIGWGAHRSMESTRTRKSSVSNTDRSGNCWRKLMSRLFSWNFLIVAYLATLIFLLSGCASTYVSTKVGGTEYVWQMSMEKNEESTDE